MGPQHLPATRHHHHHNAGEHNIDIHDYDGTGDHLDNYLNDCTNNDDYNAVVDQFRAAVNARTADHNGTRADAHRALDRWLDSADGIGCGRTADAVLEHRRTAPRDQVEP
jgi:hypothetical protein